MESPENSGKNSAEMGKVGDAASGTGEKRHHKLKQHPEQKRPHAGIENQQRRARSAPNMLRDISEKESRTRGKQTA